MKLVVKRNRELAPINSQNTQNENRAETIELIVPEEYESFNKKIVFITPNETVWDVIVNNQYKITNAITKYDKVDYYIWLTKEVDGESIDFRTKTKTLNFYHNEDASDEITDEEIHGVNTVVNILEEEIEKVENLNIEATKIGDTTTVTITKKDGTTESVEINDGTDGQDGRDGKDGDDYVITQQDYQNIANIVEQEINIPSKTSQLQNDSGFITNAVNNLTNYYLKSETYTQTEVNSLIGAISTMNLQVVQTLPTQDISTTTIYLVPKTTAETNDAYDEYIYVSNNWEHIGSTEVDLTGYATESWVNTQISNFLTETEIQQLINTAVNQKYTKPALGIPKTDLASAVQTSLNKADSAIQEHQDISGKQNITDNSLTTINKTIVGAINEVDSIAKGANQALSYSNYFAMITAFNSLANNVYNVGQNVMIITLQVPDLWISGIESTSQTYTYTTDEAFTTELSTNGYIQVGYYKLSALETQKVDLTDYEQNTNKTTTISSSSTNAQYPSAKAVYDYIQSLDGDEVSY